MINIRIQEYPAQAKGPGFNSDLCLVDICHWIWNQDSNPPYTICVAAH